MSVRRENGDKKIFMIVDNAKNKAKISLEEAGKLNIDLLYLPPYSP